MSNRIKVMLADESQAVRLLIASMLRDDARFEVAAEVSTGAEAFSRRDEVDLLVTDLVLEDMDAFSLMDDLRAVSSSVPVVIVAAVDPPYLRNEADTRGAAGFFTHRTEPARLLDQLASAVTKGPSDDAI